MGEVVNLRRTRKTRLRGVTERVAAANRAEFGRTKAERDKNARDQALHKRQLDAHLLVKPEGDG